MSFLHAVEVNRTLQIVLSLVELLFHAENIAKVGVDFGHFGFDFQGGEVVVEGRAKPSLGFENDSEVDVPAEIVVATQRCGVIAGRDPGNPFAVSRLEYGEQGLARVPVPFIHGEASLPVAPHYYAPTSRRFAIHLGMRPPSH